MRTVPAPKKQTGVSFEPHVLSFLDRIARRDKRTRSNLVNLIVEEYAARHEAPIVPVDGYDQGAAHNTTSTV